MFPIEIMGHIGKYCDYFTYKNLTLTSKIYYKNNHYNHITRCHYIHDSIMTTSQLSKIFTTACYYNDIYMIKLLINNYNISEIAKHRKRNISSYRVDQSYGMFIIGDVLYAGKDLFRYIIKYFYDNNFITKNEIETIYSMIAKLDNSAVLEYMIDEYDFLQKLHLSVFEESCKNGNIENVKIFVEKKLINPFKKYQFDYPMYYNHSQYSNIDESGFQISCLYKNDDIAEYIMNSTYFTKDLYYSVLHCAISHKRMEMVKIILNNEKYCDLINDDLIRDKKVIKVIIKILSTYDKEIINIIIIKYPQMKNFQPGFNEIRELLTNNNLNYKSFKIILNNFPYLFDETNRCISSYTFYDTMFKNIIQKGGLKMLKRIICKLKVPLDFGIIIGYTKDRNIIEYILALSGY